MKHILTYLFICLLVVSCEQEKIKQGEINYTITYPYSDASGFTLAVLPDEMSLIFSGTKMMTTIKKGKMFTTQIVTDEANKSVEMRLTLGNEKLIYTILTQEEITKLRKSQPDYKLTFTGTEDSVAGLWSKSYSVSSSIDSIKHENAWFTEALVPQNPYWFTSYEGTVGVPLRYNVERYGVLMRLDAVEFKKREVKDSEFKRDPSLKQVSFDEYEAQAQELFDILM